FLVLNRQPNSNPKDITTWGDAAVICDPWPEDKDNQVYPASECIFRLNNYYHNYRTHQHCLEKYDPDKHKLVRDIFINTDYFRKERTIKKLREIFFAEVNKILSVLKFYRSELAREVEQLELRYYGQPNNKAGILLAY